MQDLQGPAQFAKVPTNIIKFTVVRHKGLGDAYASFDCPSCGCPMEFPLGQSGGFVCRGVSYKLVPSEDFDDTFEVYTSPVDVPPIFSEGEPKQ